jgi:short-subunit dehydrogenase involved in D-alanine esterification of teichoic acids
MLLSLMPVCRLSSLFPLITTITYAPPHNYVKQERTKLTYPGIARSGEPLAQASLSEMTDHFNTNVLGPLALFQATQSLLHKSSGTGKFVVISSLVGSTSDVMALPMGVYSTSKAAVNHLTIKLQSENKDLIILPVW